MDNDSSGFFTKVNLVFSFYKNVEEELITLKKVIKRCTYPVQEKQGMYSGTTLFYNGTVFGMK